MYCHCVKISSGLRPPWNKPVPSRHWFTIVASDNQTLLFNLWSRVQFMDGKHDLSVTDKLPNHSWFNHASDDSCLSKRASAFSQPAQNYVLYHKRCIPCASYFSLISNKVMIVLEGYFFYISDQIEIRNCKAIWWTYQLVIFLNVAFSGVKMAHQVIPRWRQAISQTLFFEKDTRSNQ